MYLEEKSTDTDGGVLQIKICNRLEIVNENILKMILAKNDI